MHGYLYRCVCLYMCVYVCVSAFVNAYKIMQRVLYAQSLYPVDISTQSVFLQINVSGLSLFLCGVVFTPRITFVLQLLPLSYFPLHLPAPPTLASSHFSIHLFPLPSFPASTLSLYKKTNDISLVCPGDLSLQGRHARIMIPFDTYDLHWVARYRCIYQQAVREYSVQLWDVARVFKLIACP